MKWLADQAVGYFGWRADGQLLHKARIDINEALQETEEWTSMWFATQDIPGSQPFSGGILDAWPALAVDVFRVCRLEMSRIEAFLTSLQPKEKSRG